MNKNFLLVKKYCSLSLVFMLCTGKGPGLWQRVFDAKLGGFGGNAQTSTASRSSLNDAALQVAGASNKGKSLLPRR